MNLRVDLILPSERRSASGISMKTLYRVGSIVVPLIILAVAAYVAMEMINLSNKLKGVERVWKHTEPRREQAMRVLKQGQKNDELLAEFEGWQHARIDWHTQLEAIQSAVQPSIQFLQLRLSQALGTTKRDGTARNYRVSISGKAYGTEAEKGVQMLKDSCANAPLTKPLVSQVDIIRYSADPANPVDRVFQIEIVYKPSRFKP